MDRITEIILEKYLSIQYDDKKEMLDGFIAEINGSLYSSYRRRFPLHMKSQKYIKNFCEKVSGLDLMKDKKRFININKKNEFFEINLVINITKTLFPIAIVVPYQLNIHMINKIIKDKKMSTVLFNVSDLQKMINPECFDEFDMHIKAKKEGRDALDEIKSKNPIIVMRKNGLVNDYLINGTHRTIQAMRDGKKTIEGYVVGADLCGTCGLSKEYETLYWLMKELLFNVYGVDRNMEWTKYARCIETLPFHC